MYVWTCSSSELSESLSPKDPDYYDNESNKFLFNLTSPS